MSFTDQMGAMGVIEELRQQAIKVSEHLNLRARREEVAAKIRQYYREHNIDVTDDMINEGVRAYFDRRLTFEIPEKSQLTTKLANLYITRGLWLKKTLILLGVVLFVPIMLVIANSFYVNNQIGTMEDAIVRMDANHDKLTRTGAALLANIDALTTRAEDGKLNPVVRMLQPLRVTTISAFNTELVKMPKVSNETLDDIEVALAANQASINAASGKLAGVEIALTEVAQLMDAIDQFTSLERSDEFRRAAGQFQALESAHRKAHGAIALVDVNGANSVLSEIATVNNMLNSIQGVAAIETELNQINSAFRDMNLPDGDQATVKAAFMQVANHIRNLDAQKAIAALRQFGSLLDYARTRIELNVADRSGVKSGVERTNSGGGKSWFLVVDATDLAGNHIKVPVRDAETGENLEASTFGVRVSSDEYNRIKADKKADGHVDDRKMGFKPANSLAIRFEPRAMGATPDVITNW